MKLIIYPDVDIWEFVLSGLKNRSDIMLLSLNGHSNLFQKVSRKFSVTTHLPSYFVLGSKLRKAIVNLRQGDSVVLAEYTDPAIVSAIANIVPSGVSRYIWLWNHKGNSVRFTKDLNVIIKNKFQVFTYDETDAEKYGFHWHTQFFNIKSYKEESLRDYSYSHDFFFVGYAKNREKEIESIRKTLSDYSCNFITVHRLSEYVPYTEYMKLALHSRCIVEIVYPGDSSCTLRPLEAMALHRKLLTNNPAVRKYSFYHPQNIFILGQDDFSQLPEFLQTPYESLPDEVTDSYDVNSWVEAFK